VKNKTNRVRYFGVMISVDKIEEFRAECRRQGRASKRVTEKIFAHFLSLPTEERDAICNGNGN